MSTGSGSFKVIAALPIEREGEVRYRIKSEAENFERVADELQLSPTVELAGDCLIRRSRISP
jgi:hypothetical protein